MSAAYRTIDHLAHMRQAAGDACRFLDGLDRAAFDEDLRTQRAVLMSLVILGEAATQLMERDPDFVAKHPDWPWRAMPRIVNGRPAFRVAPEPPTPPGPPDPCGDRSLACWP